MFQKCDLLAPRKSGGMQQSTSEFSASETRRIGSFPGNTILADSEGRRWRDIHASLATVNTWSGTHEAHTHPCIAYCVNQPALLRRRLEGGREETITMRPRQFFVIPADSRSEWYRRGQTEMLMIYIRQDLLTQVAADMASLGGGGRADIELFFGATDPFLEQFAISVLELLRQEEDGCSALHIEALARAAATHLLRRGSRSPERTLDRAQSTGPATHPGLRRVRDFVEAELSGDLSLSSLADQAGLSQAVFGRAFRNAFGTSPHQYVLARRLERARTLLLSTDLPVSLIALETGFSSQSHLTTAFGQRSGLTPAQFRQAGIS